MTEPTEHACAFMMIYYGSPRERMHSASSSPARLGKVETTRSWRKGHPSPPPANSPVLPAATCGDQLTVKKAKVRTTHFPPGHPGKVESKFTKTALISPCRPYLLCCSSRAFPGVTWGPCRLTLLPPASPHLPSFSQMIIIAGNQPSPSHSMRLQGA